MSEQHSTEIWKPVEGYPGYEVSNLGRIRSRRPTLIGEPRLMRPSLSRKLAGYPHIVFCISGKRTGHYIHRLVATAFIGPIPDGMEVNHRSGIKTDNRLANLEILSIRDNSLHSYRELGRTRHKPEHIVRDPINGRIVGIRKHL